LPDVFAQLPARSVDVIVTSPPYNLGIQYNQYQDTLSRSDYLQWTNAWVAAAARVLRPEGSLFLNVGAKPTDPWTALDVAQAVRPHLRLQNIIHWVKSIAIERSAAGSAAGLTRDLAVGHYKPINSDRFLNDCHEFIFHFTRSAKPAWSGWPLGSPTRTNRTSAAGGGGRRRALPREHVVHPVRDDSAARSRPPASGDLSVAAAGTVRAPARAEADSGGDGPVYGPRQHSRRVRPPRRQLHRGRRRRDLLAERRSPRVRATMTGRPAKVRSLKSEGRRPRRAV
jgi:hypothetical protein